MEARALDLLVELRDTLQEAEGLRQDWLSLTARIDALASETGEGKRFIGTLSPICRLARPWTGTVKTLLQEFEVGRV